ncbi:OprO/OprP family phosphate-selective porin [Reichenbachiella ulvae]|uniref:OprO/OprP family phosphate-selective porin n=1 Tax=Reichenbachiella ulvae TaxID=2980104 RepID=A0ABT3CRD1_9BACT|nr:OprO/OprP family phosphate-selective porin [Reichenbachiella ulvae]MCV9386261.1 OprO/OprP family phosphate-selective porin [Reichenbachiella ulvae]
MKTLTPKCCPGLSIQALRLFTICAFIFINLVANAQNVTGHSLIIRNANVITNSSDTSQYYVNLLIIDDVLELISTEELSKSEDIEVWDANGGYLLGNLVINAAPRFIILNEDPRKNFDIWLNIEPYTVFAMNNGEIHVNRLEESTHLESTQKDPYSRVKWFAYTPPPFALPINYSMGSKWNHWNKENFKGLIFGALAMDRLYWLSQNEANERQVGNLKSNAGGEIRGLRFGVIGSVKVMKRPWSYTFFMATNAFEKGFEENDLNNLTVYDYRLDIPIKNVTLSIGKQKEPISFERVPSSLFNSMQERVSDAFQPGRNIGIQASGNLLKSRVSWAGGVFNPWVERKGSFTENETIYVGRLTAVPWASETGTNLLHIGVSNRYSDGQVGTQYQITPEFNKSINFMQTGFIDTDQMNLSSFELGYLSGPYWFYSEYTLNQIKAVGESWQNLSSFQMMATWVISGEHRKYRFRNGTLSPIPIAIGVNQGGRGAWELAVRYSNYNLNANTIRAGLMNVYSAGLNWWPTSYACVSFNYRLIQLDHPNERGITSGLNTRILLLLN